MERSAAFPNALRLALALSPMVAPGPAHGASDGPVAPRLEVHRVASPRGEVVLRPSSAGDSERWRGLLQATHHDSGGGVAYWVDLRLADGPAATVDHRLLEYLPPLGSRCRPAATPPDPPAATGKGDGDGMAFYRCAFRRCFSRSRACAASGTGATGCLASRCRDALLACLHDTLGCSG